MGRRSALQPLDLRSGLAQPRLARISLAGAAVRGLAAGARLLRNPDRAGSAALARARSHGQRSRYARDRRDPLVPAGLRLCRGMAPLDRGPASGGVGRSPLRRLWMAAESIRALPEPLHLRPTARALVVVSLPARSPSVSTARLRRCIRVDRRMEPLLPDPRGSVPPRPGGEGATTGGGRSRARGTGAVPCPLRCPRACARRLRRLEHLWRRARQRAGKHHAPTAAPALVRRSGGGGGISRDRLAGADCALLSPGAKPALVAPGRHGLLVRG